MQFGDTSGHLTQLAGLDTNLPENKICFSGIVCTIGPVSTDQTLLVDMMTAGMTVARLNFSHGSHKEHGDRIDTIRKAGQTYRKQCGREYPLAIALDTKGPEIRTGVLEQGDRSKIELKTGNLVNLTTDPKYARKSTDKIIYVSYAKLAQVLQIGNNIYVDDGKIILECAKIESDTAISCKIINGGLLGSKKGVNLPGIKLGLPAVSELDKEDLKFGVEKGVDIIFASFIHDARDVQEIRNVLGEGGKNIWVISKIENQEALDNIDAIIEASDGIMVARGDLALQIPFKKVVLAQKSIIAKCNLRGKPVICATQMLESMMNRERPSRADVSDVANAIFDGADGVMLSGETAVGDYPVKCVKTMAGICKQAEVAVWNGRLFHELVSVDANSKSSVSSAAAAAVTASIVSDASAIILISTEPLPFAACLSKYKPKCSILVIVEDQRIAGKLDLFRAVHSLIRDDSSATPGEELLALKYAEKIGMAKKGDRIVILTYVHLTWEIRLTTL